MQLNKKNIESKETSFVSTLMFRFLPYWPLFMVLILLGFLSAWVYLRYAKPLYEVSATILIKDEQKGVEESDVLKELEINSSKKIIENEIEVIHSRKLMKDVVNQLHLYAPVFEDNGLITTSAYITSPITILAKNPDLIKDTDFIIPFSIQESKLVIINNKSYPLQSWVSTPYGELRFEQNTKKLKQALSPLFFRLSNPKSAASALLQNLDVTAANKLSTVAKLTLKDEVPERGEDILNRLIETYNQTSVNEKNLVIVNTLAFVEKRLQGVERELSSLEGNIQQFRSTKGAVNLSEQAKLFLHNVGDNDQKVADLNMQLGVLDFVESYVNSNQNKTAIVPSALGINDPGLSQLTQKLYSAKVEYEKIRETTGDKNPMVVAAAREIEEIRPQILEKISNDRKSLRAGINNLNATNGSYNSMLRSIPEKERELTEISREQTIKNSVYSFLLRKREETALAISTTVPDSRIVDAGEASDGPVSPKKSFVFLVALIFPMGLGVVGIYAKELFNKKVLFRSEIESFTNLPVITELSHIKKKESLSNKSSQVSFAADQFRQLRASLGLCGTFNNYSKRILVTSSISGEGKTYISTNLAISLALSGKKVVLVDLDIYNPKASLLLGVAAEAGIAEFLEGVKRPEEIIKKTRYDNLHVVGAGHEFETTRELILNGSLNDLFGYLDIAFDYIIMDACPVDLVTDAYVFREYCDATLLVIRHGYTPKLMVKALNSSKKIKALKNVSIVFNDVKSRGIFKGKYGYGYGFGYENVYREKSRKNERKLATSSRLSEVVK
jgi:capsular exopolysaccharide synthesis family protein